MRKAIVLTAPAHWACYLLNGELNLDPCEYMEVENFLTRQGVGRPVSCQPAGFMWRHDAFNESPYGADCEEYTFLSC